MSEQLSDRTTQVSIQIDDGMPPTVPLRLAPRRARETRVAPRPYFGPDDAGDCTLTPSLRAATCGPARPAAAPVKGQLRLHVVRGQKVNVDYPIYDGANYLGRRDDEPIDINLDDQEPPDRIWTSRKHAVIHLTDGVLEVEDLDSLNGTFVNRTRVTPGERRPLQVGDVLQVGTIQFRVFA